MVEPINENAEQYETREQKANKKARFQWIIVAVVVMILGCGLITALAVGVGGLVYRRSNRTETWEGQNQETVERSFEVGDGAMLEIDSRAGSITVVRGEGDRIRIRATKLALGASDLDKVTVEMSQSGDTIRVETLHQGMLNNTSVQIVAEVPAFADLDLQTSAGSVKVEGISGDMRLFTSAGSMDLADISGDVRAKSSAGSIEAYDMRGPVRLESSAGSIKYRGDPRGDCVFESSAGSVTLWLPADLAAQIDAYSSAGSVQVEFPVDGSVKRDRVEGTVGDGSQAEIKAHSSAGGVRINRR